MRTEADVLTDDAQALCPGCMRPVEGEPDYCPHCNAPLGIATMIGPYSEARPMAFAYLRGAERPTTPSRAFGMVAFLGATLCIGLGLIAFSIYWMLTQSSWDSIGEVFIGLIFTAIGGTGIFKTLRNYKRVRAGARSSLSRR